jgi:hypothetical protein
MKITIKNIIKENIDPEEKYINKLSGILKPPYFYNLIVTETPENLWNKILSKVFNQEVTHYIWVNSDRMVLFDSNNNKIYNEDSNGYWEKQEYDSNNNQIYYEDSNGDWIKREYDLNNNKIYHEDNNGYWEKYEYDSNDYLIYYEDSNGYWEKREYDSNGKRIYYENSDGEIDDNRSSNPINENIDPEEKYINGIVNMISSPYFKFLKVTETPTYLWNKILSKVFNQEVTQYIGVNNDNNIFNSNNNLIYKEYSNGYWFKQEYDSNNNLIYNENSDGVIRIDRRSSNTINENIDPEEKYVNKLSNILKPPYFYNLKITETPTYLWNKILSKIFNQEVTQYFAVNSDNRIFNSNGNVIYREDSNGYWEKREYNSNGNLIYYENSDGYWEKREYESKGNLIYYGNSDGEIKEYDSNGSRIYSENSDGYWVKREYDSKGNLIYYEDSNGEIRGNRSSNTINEYGQF